MNDSKNLLMIGPPRSGTTLLAAMLSCHSDISILMEEFQGSNELILSKKIKGVKLCIPNQIELEKRSNLFIRGVRKIPIISSTKFCATLPLSELSIRDYQRRGNLQIIGIIRAPENVIASIKKRGGQTLDTAIYRWSRAMEILYTLLFEDASSIAVVGYEKLTGNPKGTMEKACAFLDVSFQEDLLEGYRHTPQYKKHSGIVRPMTKNAPVEYRNVVKLRYLDFYERLLANTL